MGQEEADAVAALLAAASGDIPAKRSDIGEGLATFLNHPLSLCVLLTWVWHACGIGLRFHSSLDFAYLV